MSLTGITGHLDGFVRRSKGCWRRFPRHGGTPASIEIVVDNAVAGWPAFVFALNLFRDMVLARVLFHELGHHLDATIGAAAPTGEAAAEDWNRRLGRLYFRRRYWWLRPFTVVVRPVGSLSEERVFEAQGLPRNHGHQLPR
jgi:hypothetical protein